MYAIWTGTSASASITGSVSLVAKNGVQIFSAVSGSANDQGNSKTLKNERDSFNNSCIDWYGDYAKVYAKVNCNVTISGTVHQSPPDESSYCTIKIYRDDSSYSTIKDYENKRFGIADVPISTTVYLSSEQRLSLRCSGGKDNGDIYRRSFYSGTSA